MTDHISDPIPTCPRCGQTTKQHRADKNLTGTARRECRHCGRTYTPNPKPYGYERAVRQQALAFYVDGLNFRPIARHLGVNPQTVANCVTQAAANLPASALPKERAYVITCVDRATRCILGFGVV